MNIQAASLLSLLSGTEAAGDIQQSLTAGAGANAGFASALLQQLGLLQGGQAADANTIQSLMQDPAVGDGLQNLAAFLGQKLPAGSKSVEDIDLDETLQTLADVMQQLQQLEAGADVQVPVPVPAQQQADTDADTDAEGDADAATLSAMPLNSVPTEDAATQQPSEILESGGLPLDGKKQAAMSLLDAKKQDVATAGAATMSGTMDVDMERSISSALAKDGNEDKLPQDKPNLNTKADDLLSRADDAGDSQTVKTPANVAADVARMAGSVREGTGSVSQTTQSALHKDFADPGWQQALGDKLIWMHKQNIPSVELRLNPEHLGPVMVKIDVSHDQASVAFTTQHLAVKEAIEAAIPKLREMLGGQQLNLTDVNVSQQQSDQRQSAREFFQMAGQQGRNSSAGGDATNSAAVNEAQHIVDEIEAGRAIATNGLLSLFA